MCDKIIKGQILNVSSSWGCNKVSTHKVPNTRVNHEMNLCTKHFNSWYKSVKDKKWFVKKYSGVGFVFPPKVEEQKEKI